MCGIVGLVSAAPVDPALVARMRDTLAHRGPDHAGLWRSPDGRVCLGHRRLAIIDLDPRASQPMVSADGRFTITFNGEIYNYRELRSRLEREGAAFRTQSDTEVILEAFRLWGRRALDELTGMFAFGLWDARERRLTCARDRAGEKPLYYAQAGGTFAFASELKALAEWPGMPREVDYEAVIDFLSFGFVPDPKSIWRGVRKLAPAHWLAAHLGDDGVRSVEGPAPYWQLAFVPGGRRPGDEEIRDTITRAVGETAVADVPLGTFLSGGVDSSTVTAALSRSGHDVRSFTIGFEHAAYDERAWARQVAERYKTRHVERVVDDSDAATVLDRLTWHYDEPFSDYSSIPTYYLCREARGAITVALSGDGADELFGGYTKYQRLARRAELAGILPPGLARVAAGLSRLVLPETNRARRTLGQYGMAPAEMLADMLSHGFPLPVLRQVARGPLARALAHYDPHRLVESLLQGAPPERVGLVNAMRHLDFALTLPGDMLVKVDRASMAVSLEVRPAFLHRDVMEMAARIPGDDVASRDAAKLALKRAVRPWLPDGLIDRKKQGFALPLPEWLSGETRVGAAVLGYRAEGPVGELLDMERLDQIARAQARGAVGMSVRIYSAFALDRWFARWMPSPGAATPHPGFAPLAAAR